MIAWWIWPLICTLLGLLFVAWMARSAVDQDYGHFITAGCLMVTSAALAVIWVLAFVIHVATLL